MAPFLTSFFFKIVLNALNFVEIGIFVNPSATISLVLM